MPAIIVNQRIVEDLVVALACYFYVDFYYVCQTAQLGQSKPNVEISEDVSLPETKRKCTKRVILLSILYVAGSIQTVT